MVKLVFCQLYTPPINPCIFKLYKPIFQLINAHIIADFSEQI